MFRITMSPAAYSNSTTGPAVITHRPSCSRMRRSRGSGMPSRMAATAADMPLPYQSFNNYAQISPEKTACHGPAASLLPDLGLEHALASRRLYTDGAEVLFDYATHAGDTPEGDSARELVVVRNNQRVFSEVVQAYLQRVDFAADGYAQLIRLPQYRAAEVTIDPDHGFGRPRFSRGGASVEDVIDLFRAGEPVDAVADEYGLSRNEVEDAIRVATRAVA